MGLHTHDVRHRLTRLLTKLKLCLSRDCNENLRVLVNCKRLNSAPGLSQGKRNRAANSRFDEYVRLPEKQKRRASRGGHDGSLSPPVRSRSNLF